MSTLSQTKSPEPVNLSEQDVRIACLKGHLRINGGRFSPADYWSGKKKNTQYFNDDLCMDDLEAGDKLDILLGYSSEKLLVFRVSVVEVNKRNKNFKLQREWLETDYLDCGELGMDQLKVIDDELSKEYFVESSRSGDFVNAKDTKKAKNQAKIQKHIQKAFNR